MKMTKAEQEEALVKTMARLTVLENENSELKSKVKAQDRLSLKDYEAILFPKKSGAKPKSPDFQGELQVDGRRLRIALWFSPSGKVMRGKITDPLAEEVEREETRDPSFIPSVDVK